MAALALSFDIGGTFTDFVVIDVESGILVRRHKVLTNVRDPAAGVLSGWHNLVSSGTLAPNDTTLLVHSTTLVTNALIERKGAKTVLLATRGFRDVLELGTQQMYDIYDLFAPVPEPLIPRPFRLEVDERIAADGQVLLPLQSDALQSVIAYVRGSGAEAVAIAFLHSYLNPDHERQVAAALQAALPNVAISLSSVVAPIAGEYERTSTVAADAFAKPAVRRYLHSLSAALASRGVAAPLHLTLSSGEIASTATAAEYPIRLLESGPAAGAMAASFFGRLAGYHDILSLDMGGTTAKACVIEGGSPEMAQVLEVARTRRFMKGSGLPVVAPVVDLIEIGAGGGSIARRDELGLLRVGPDSAGSDPGPACYGLGGDEPTVSDANLILGYLNPDYFLGGEIPLRADLAREAVGRLARALGLPLEDTAWGIHRVVNENMAAAARVHIIERNRDPRDLATIAFGGAGPAHAVAVARVLGSPIVVFPPAAGVASALGALVAPLAFTAGRTRMMRLDQAAWNLVNRLFQELEAEAIQELAAANVGPEQVSIHRWAEMRVLGQYHEISVPLDGLSLDALGLPAMEDAFHDAYRRRYGRVLHGLPIEALHWRITATGPASPVHLEPRVETQARADTAIKTWREACFPTGNDAAGASFRQTPIYDRELLAPGMRFSGPAIVEEREATAVIWPGDEAWVDRYGAIIIELIGQQGQGQREDQA
jgi:N-methylhydantoinase A/oxoprolinase/acetone carboxylase beta subunit